MARDEHLLYSGQVQPAALRLYAWDPPTISLGYFQRLSDAAALPPPLGELAVVRRSTGGGAILHDWEITYCLVLDAAVAVARQAPTALYRLVHEVWRDVLGPAAGAELAPDDFPLPTPRSGPFFCFARPGRTDLIIGAGKLLGSAQRRIPGRVLQHGSLLLGQRFPQHPGVCPRDATPAKAAQWSAEFIRGLAARLEFTPQTAGWTSAMLADVAARREKFASPAWNGLR